MTPALLFRDIGSLTLQVAAIVAAGSAAWTVLRVRNAVVSHAYWRVLLLVCLLLPIAQPRHVALPAAIHAAPSSTGEGSDRVDLTSAPSAALPPPRTWPASEVVLALLVAGIAVRALWLTLGVVSLRRLRQTAARLDPLAPGFRAAELKVGARADVYVSDCVSSPMTFGFARPIVLVPPGVLSMDVELQEAIACHELLHVRRRDWLHVIVEEIIRTVFWFHPAIWWLTSRIQLSREHVVDEAVIRLTDSRDRYVEAMLAVALPGSPLVAAPAPPFLRRRSLKKRVAHILQETTMTARRLIASLAVSAAAVALTIGLAVRAFPLEARASRTLPSPQTVSTAGTAPVEIVRGGEHLQHATLPQYPRRARERRVEGEVTLELTIDDRGEVSDARVLSGAEELRRAALESVLQWHFSPDRLRSTLAQVSMKFNASAAESARGAVRTISVVGPNTRHITYNIIKEAMIVDRSRRPTRLATDGSQRLSQFRTERIPQPLAEKIRERAGFAIGDAVSEALIKRVREAVLALDEHLSVRFEPDGKGGVILVISGPK